MRFLTENTGQKLIEQMGRDDALRRDAVDRAMSAHGLGEQMRFLTENTDQKLIEQMGRDDALRRDAVDRAMSAHGLGEQMRFLTENTGQKLIEQMGRDDALRRELVLDQARETANLAQALALPTAIERFRTQIEPFADKLLHLPSLEWVRQSDYLAAFNQTSAVADFLEGMSRVDRELRDATRAFGIAAIPTFDSLAGYRHFLDAAGLVLPRWPRFRLLSFAEKRRRLQARLKQNAEPTHVRQAKSLVHRYEVTLRSIVDGLMAQSYARTGRNNACRSAAARTCLENGRTAAACSTTRTMPIMPES
jgi:hypothetical protein